MNNKKICWKRSWIHHLSPIWGGNHYLLFHRSQFEMVQVFIQLQCPANLLQYREPWRQWTPSLPISEKGGRAEPKSLLLAGPPGWQWGGAAQLSNKRGGIQEVIPRHLTSIECGDAVTHCLGHYHHPSLLQLAGFGLPNLLHQHRRTRASGNPILPGTNGTWSTNASWKTWKKLQSMSTKHIASQEAAGSIACSQVCLTRSRVGGSSFSGHLRSLWNQLLCWIFPFLLFPSQRKFLNKFSS